MSYTLGRTKFKIRVLYKSGNSHSLWVYSFNIKDGNVTYHPISPKNRPVLFNYDEVEAIYQIGHKVTVWPFYSPL